MSTQRIFVPDDDSTTTVSWPTPPKPKRTLTDWVPGTFLLICLAIVFLSGLVGSL